MLQKLLLIAAAGGMGAMARYGLAGVVHRVTDSMFPWGTVVVNLLGCFLYGTLWSLMEPRLSISPETRTIILVGFMGAFTTFSTFAFETTELLEGSQWLQAAGNVAVQNFVGIAALFLGLAIGRLL